jgi:sugar (pentulose or hexulose) kinase
VINFGVGGDLDHLDPARDTLANVDAYGRAVPSSRFMGGREFEILSAEIGTLEDEDVSAAIAPAIEKGIMLLPNVAPGSGPFPGKTGRWVNADGKSAAERLAAACLYLALMTDACLDLVGASGPIIVEGPFCSNDPYLIILAALTGRHVIAVPGSTGTSAGAALLAGVRSVQGAEKRFAPSDIAGLQVYRDRWFVGMA